MTLKDEADRVAAALKTAADSRKALNQPPRKGEIHPAIVVGNKAIEIHMPWTMINDSSVDQISEHIMSVLHKETK